MILASAIVQAAAISRRRAIKLMTDGRRDRRRVARARTNALAFSVD